MSRFKTFDLIKGIVGEKFNKKHYDTNGLKKTYDVVFKKYNELFNNSINIIKVSPLVGVNNYVYNPVNSYGVYKTLLYKGGFDSLGRGIGTSLDNSIATGNIEVFSKENVWAPPGNIANNANAFNTALNRSGLWFNSATAVGPFSFSVEFTSECDGTMYVGIGTDNRYRINLNGTVIIDNFNVSSLPYYTSSFFNYAISNAQYHQFLHWNIYPIPVNKGANTIILEGLNPDGPSLPGYFGMEIYDDSAENIKNATLDPDFVASPGTYDFAKNYYTNLNMIFSSRFIRQSTALTSGEELVFENRRLYECVYSNDRLVAAVQNQLKQYKSKTLNVKKDLEKSMNFLFYKLFGCCEE